MCDRSKQIIPGLLNVVKKKEDEAMVNRRGVKCMFWMMVISWTIYLLFLVFLVQRNCGILDEGFPKLLGN